LNVAGLVACGGFLTHSAVDYNLHIPSNALLFFLAATLATASVTPSPRRKTTVSPGIAAQATPD
jgi:hypothetical protein